MAPAKQSTFRDLFVAICNTIDLLITFRLYITEISYLACLFLFPSGLSRSPVFWNVEFDDLNVLSTPDTSPFSVTLRLSENFPVSNFVIVPADKASNNFTFVCKKYYVSILIEELGLKSLPGNPTYNLTDFSASEVLDNHKSVLTSFGIDPNEDELYLSYIYWIPKMHKNPYKHRFIAGSARCSTKPLSILLTTLLTHIKQGLQKYCETAYSRSGVNQMWILKNSKELLEHLESPNFNNITRPFHGYQNFWPSDLDLEVWPTFKNTLTLALLPNQKR